MKYKNTHQIYYTEMETSIIVHVYSCHSARYTGLKEILLISELSLWAYKWCSSLRHYLKITNTYILHKCTNCRQHNSSSLLCHHHQWIFKQVYVPRDSIMTTNRATWLVPFSLRFFLCQTCCKQCICNTYNTKYSEITVVQLNYKF